MKTYRWRGPVQSLTITHEGKELELRLMPGREVELPAEHPMVQCWAGSGWLEEAQPPRRRKKEVNNA